MRDGVSLALLHQHEWPTVLSLSSDSIMCFHPRFLFLFLLNCFGKASTMLYNCGNSVHSFFFSIFFSQDFSFSHGVCCFLYDFGKYYLSIIIKMLTWDAFSIFSSPFCFFLFFSKIKYFLIFRHTVLIYSFCFMSQTIVPRCFPAGLARVIRKCPLCISKHFLALLQCDFFYFINLWKELLKSSFPKFVHLLSSVNP